MALGLLNQICNFKFVLSLELFHFFLFNETSLLVESLQHELIQITKARKLVSSVCHQLQQARKKSDNWNSIWSKSVVICKNKKIPIEKEVLPTVGIRPKRPRKLPAALDNFLVEAPVEQHNDTLDTSNEYRTKVFYPIVDRMVEELQYHFSSENESLQWNRCSLFNIRHIRSRSLHFITRKSYLNQMITTAICYN